MIQAIEFGGRFAWIANERFGISERFALIGFEEVIGVNPFFEKTGKTC